MFKNPAAGVQGYEVSLLHPVRCPALYGSMCMFCCTFAPVIPQFGLSPSPSSRVTHHKSAATKPISSSNLSHPLLTMIYIPLSPSSNFPHSRLHLSSVRATDQDVICSSWRGYSGKIREKKKKGKSWCWVESSDGVNVEFLPCRWERLQFVGQVCVSHVTLVICTCRESRGPEVKLSLAPLPLTFFHNLCVRDLLSSKRTHLYKTEGAQTPSPYTATWHHWLDVWMSNTDEMNANTCCFNTVTVKCDNKRRKQSGHFWFRYFKSTWIVLLKSREISAFALFRQRLTV